MIEVSIPGFVLLLSLRIDLPFFYIYVHNLLLLI